MTSEIDLPQDTYLKIEDIIGRYNDFYSDIHDPILSPMLVAEGLCYTYKAGRGETKIGPINQRLHRGEILGVVGVNASGKTTLLKMLIGQLKPQSGSLRYPCIDWDGTKSWQDKRSEIAYVSQMPDPWQGRAFDNLCFVAAAYGKSGEESTRLVTNMMRRYGLIEFQNHTWAELSAGYRIRFEILKALLMRPKLLVLDEPLAYLDIIAQQLVLSDLRKRATSLNDPIAVVVTSQHLYEIESVANKMLILDDGEVLYSGPNLELTPDTSDLYCEISIKNGSRTELEAVMQKSGLDAEVTASATSFIVKVKNVVDRVAVKKIVFDALSVNLVLFRDISKSSRRYLTSGHAKEREASRKAVLTALKEHAHE